MRTPLGPPTPVTVLTGFLGSGKTTLLNRLLSGHHGIRFGVLVNDFGEINIDARLVSAVDGQAVDLSNGCVCCTMQGDLVTAVRRMLARAQPPEHVIVEASGISDPLGIVAAFRTPALRERTRLESVLAVVDAENATNPRFDQQLVQSQIRAADLVLLNKIDLVTDSRRACLRDWLRDIGPDVPILHSVRADVPIEAILNGAPRRRYDELPAGILSSHGLRTWAYHTERPLAYRRVAATMKALPVGIIRLKGILQLADAPNLRFAAHRVGRRSSIDVIGPWEHDLPESELVMLGEPNCLSAEELTALFDQCATDTIPLMQAANFARRTQRSK